jgi:hypothetical protein
VQINAISPHPAGNHLPATIETQDAQRILSLTVAALKHFLTVKLPG